MEERKIKFEDKIGEIDIILQNKRGFWNLEAIASISYEDVSQIIRLHLYNKFSLWNQSKSFGAWASEVISNQLVNLRQKYYGKFAPPCKGCEYNLGDTKCAMTLSGEKSSECLEFEKWEKKKERAYRLLLAESADKSFDEDPDGEGRIRIEAPVIRDYQKASERLHELMLDCLEPNPKMVQVYTLCFIEHRSDEYAAKKLGLKGVDIGKRFRYKQLENLKKLLVLQAKKIMSDLDIFANE